MIRPDRQQERIDQLEQLLAAVMAELKEYRSLAEKFGAEKAVSELAKAREQLAERTRERDQYCAQDLRNCGEISERGQDIGTLTRQLATARQAVLDELTQWAASQSVAIGHRFITGRYSDEISAYRLALEDLHAKLKEMTP